MLTTKGVRELLKRPWWTLVKNEVGRTVAIRVRAESPNLKPHGSVLGQMFIDLLNSNPDCRAYFHYLTTRTWEEVLMDIAEDVSEEMTRAFRHEEAAKWFGEFQGFLNLSWKNSISPPPDAPPVAPWIRLFCPRCAKPVGKVDQDGYWKIWEAQPFFCVWHLECEGLKNGEELT